MDRADQRVALVWIYTGQTPYERLETIGSIDGQHLELIVVGNAEVQRAAELFSFSRPNVSLKALDSVSMQAIWQAIPPTTRAVVFWIDDEKLVSPGFPLEMAAPILESDPALERHLHYWDGNALAISRSIAEAMTLEDMNLRDDCLLTMLSDVVDHRGRIRGSRVRVMFSPLEKFAAMAMEPMGLAS
jgi:hypothetical protein